MSIQTITLMPSTNTEVTETQGVAQITQSNLIRFKPAGDRVLVEKLGGWEKYYPTGMGSAARALRAWEGINNDFHLAVGCTETLNVITDGLIETITPRTLTTNPAVSFSTTNGSPTVKIVDAGLTVSVYDSIYILTPVAVGGLILQGAYSIASVVSSNSYNITAAANATSTVANGGAVPSFATTIGSPTITVTLTAHGYQVGQAFAIPTPTTVGGILLSGNYLIFTVPTANTFTIQGTNNATSSTTGSMNGGNASIIYYITVAPPSPYAGYGIGTYGTGAYGIGTAPSPSPGTAITATNWTLDNWGEILIACPADGPIFYWSPDSGYTTATKIVGAPLINGGVFIAQPAQILVSWGSSTNSIPDPLNINWSDATNFLEWTVSSRTQAGGFRIPTGSKIVGGMSGPNFNIIWTDLDVWSMDYIEPPLVYGFNALASNCGLIGRHAMGVMNTTVYWMGFSQFYRLDGESVQSIPCSVWDAVFQNLDLSNADKITCATNTLFGEVTFYYPSLNGGGEVDSYVKMSTLIPNCWDYGPLQRTAWIDQSVLGQPIGADATGLIYQHETSPDADGQPLMAWFETGYSNISEGDELMFADWIFPDFKYGTYAGDDGAIIDISISFADYPNSAAKTRGPYSVTSATTYVNTRLRGRYVKMRISSSDLGSFWRMGGLKVRATADGRR